MSLRVIGFIFIGTLICNLFGVLYSRLVMREKHLKATLVSVIMAGVTLYVWKFVLKEDDINGATAFVTYLVGDALGTYAGFKVPLEKQEVLKK